MPLRVRLTVENVLKVNYVGSELEYSYFSPSYGTERVRTAPALSHHHPLPVP